MAHKIKDGREEAPDKPYPDGVVEIAKEQFEQGDRGFYANAFFGDTELGALKGNRAQEPEQAPAPLTGEGPFTNLRGGNR